MDDTTTDNDTLNAHSSARERLLRATLTTFTSRGHQRTTVDDITRKAVISRPTFYAHFENKSDAISQALQELWLSLSAELKVASINLPSLEAKSSARISAYFSWWCKRAELGKRVFSELNDSNSPIFAIREGMISALAQYWTEQLRHKNPSITIDELEISALLSMIEQLCMKFISLSEEARKIEKQRYINSATIIMHSYLMYKK